MNRRLGVFTTEARERVATELTNLVMACEHLADTPAIRSGVWVIFVEHGHDALFNGGEVASRPIMALLINAIKGGLDDPGLVRPLRMSTPDKSKIWTNNGTERRWKANDQ